MEATAAVAESKDAFESRHLVNMGPPVSLPLTHISAADEVRCLQHQLMDVRSHVAMQAFTAAEE